MPSGRHRAVGNPDAFMVEIHIAGSVVAGGFLGTSAGKKGAMEEGHLHFSGVIGNGDGEEAGILVVHMDEINAVIRSKGREPEPLPVKQILRDGQGNPRADRTKAPRRSSRSAGAVQRT